jgi:putative glutathione S-transferase
VLVLCHTQTRTIVNNESSEIIVMLNREFDQWGDATVDLYSHALAPEIDRINDIVYDGLNNAVYRAGFANDQPAYEEAVINPTSAYSADRDRRFRHRDRSFRGS